METAIVAGVGPGLGASLARAFSREGYSVGLLSRSPQSSEPVADQIRSRGGKAVALSVDVTQRTGVFEAVGKIRGELGSVTAIAYNASRSEEHTSELQSRLHLVCRLLL